MTFVCARAQTEAYAYYPETAFKSVEIGIVVVAEVILSLLEQLNYSVASEIFQVSL